MLLSQRQRRNRRFSMSDKLRRYQQRAAHSGSQTAGVDLGQCRERDLGLAGAGKCRPNGDRQPRIGVANADNATSPKSCASSIAFVGHCCLLHKLIATDIPFSAVVRLTGSGFHFRILETICLAAVDYSKKRTKCKCRKTPD